MNSAKILIFAKAPMLGKVKTRLIPKMGDAGALQLHLTLLEKILTTACTVDNAEIELWLSNPCELSELGGELESIIRSQLIKVHIQQGHDLGERMAFAVEQNLGAGQNLVLLGADCLAVSEGYIQSALSRLHVDQISESESVDEVVIGPAEDGGYVMMAIASRVPYSHVAPLFEGVSWGTSTVLAETKSIASKQSINMGLLSACWDVDRWEDVLRAKREGLL